MTLETIIARAKLLRLPLAKNEFRETLENPIPAPPYLVYLIPSETGRGADAINNIKEIHPSLELYTDKTADDSLEKRIEKEVLYDVEYEKFQTTIESEELVQTAYEFTLICKNK